MKCNLLLLLLVIPKVVIFYVCCSLSLVYGTGFSEESAVLLEFKSSVSDPYGILSSWEGSNSSHCSWFGVTCSSGSRVVALSIPGGEGIQGNSEALSCSKSLQFPYHGFGTERTCGDHVGKLKGKLSPLIGRLRELRILSLPFNELSGDIPMEIWGLENLEVLDLEGNLFSGRLPYEFVGLEKLRVLNLGFNRLDGNIPISLSRCADLEVLNLAGNQLKGSIPGIFGSLLKLKGVYLGKNELNGGVPADLGSNCQYLEHLDLSANFLVGGIPAALGNCWQLRTLLLHSNMLTGVIPRELGLLRRLQVLDVSRNFINGMIPADLGNCVELSVLVLSNLFETWPDERYMGQRISVVLPRLASDRVNHFHGSIPEEITTLPKLRVLWAPQVNLEGYLPSNWGNCESLEMVNLAHNAFNGIIDAAFHRCKKLYYLDLSSNNLSGKLDQKLPVPCMTFLDVSHNLLSGPIPRFNYSMCHTQPASNFGVAQVTDPFVEYASFLVYKTRLASQLPFSPANAAVIHNFGGNKFAGPIGWLPVVPQRFGKQTDYAFLASRNNLTGSLGSLFGMCGKLQGMIADISKNRIGGPIPLKIGAMCKSLKFLDASQNQISGSIPESLGDLKSLVTLDLSGNRLQGLIPLSLYQLKHLRHVSLAGNKLTGAIPFGWLHSLKELNLSSNSQGVAQLRSLSTVLLDNKKQQIPPSLTKARSLFTMNVPLNNLSGSFPADFKLVNCSNSLGDPSSNSCQMVSLSALSSDPANSSGDQGSDATPPPENNSGSNGFTSIEIASIVSASTIVAVLLVLVILFFYTRKRVPNARVQVSEPKEITTFLDIGVPLVYENIVQATGNFNASNCIGSGGFGATYKAEIAPGMLVAIKRLAVGRFQGVQQFHNEIEALGRVRHRHLVTLIGYHASETEMFLIYNYLPGGNLEDFIKERSARDFNWKILHKIALDIARALAYLHDQCAPRVLHRDVKPSNILLDSHFNAYLSDFGLSRLLGPSETHATTGVAGTFGYVAPEYAMTCRVSEKADVYSYGVVLLELMSDKKALDPSFSSHENGFNIVSWACMLLRHGKAKEVFTPGLWDAGPHDDLVDMLHLAVTCTVDTLSNRPTMKQVVQRLKQIQPS